MAERTAQERFLEQFTDYTELCRFRIDEELRYEGRLDGMGGPEGICADVEQDVMEGLPAGEWPWRWPWLPDAVWSVDTHHSYHVLFRDATREAVRCLSLTSSLRQLDPSTRSIILQGIIGRAAPTHSTDAVADPWLPRLFAIPPRSLSNSRKRKWKRNGEQRASAMSDYVSVVARGVRRCPERRHESG